MMILCLKKEKTFQPFAGEMKTISVRRFGREYSVRVPKQFFDENCTKCKCWNEGLLRKVAPRQYHQCFPRVFPPLPEYDEIFEGAFEKQKGVPNA